MTSYRPRARGCGSGRQSHLSGALSALTAAFAFDVASAAAETERRAATSLDAAPRPENGTARPVGAAGLSEARAEEAVSR